MHASGDDGVDEPAKSCPLLEIVAPVMRSTVGGRVVRPVQQLQLQPHGHSQPSMLCNLDHQMDLQLVHRQTISFNTTHVQRPGQLHVHVEIDRHTGNRKFLMTLRDKLVAKGHRTRYVSNPYHMSGQQPEPHSC
jgi:hypothetical protein